MSFLPPSPLPVTWLINPDLHHSGYRRQLRCQYISHLHRSKILVHRRRSLRRWHRRLRIRLRHCLVRIRWNRIHRYHGRRDQEPHQEPSPRCQERLLAYPSILHPLGPPNWTQCPLQHRRPLHEENFDLSLYHRFPDGGRQSRRKLHQCSDHD